MPSLFSLPDDLCIALFALWIGIEDLTVFDTSISNTLDRNQFLELIRSSSFVQNTQRMYVAQSYFNWLALREIKVKNLNLQSYDRKMLSPAIKKIVTNTKNHMLRRLQMEYCSNLARLLNHALVTVESLSLVESDTLNDESFSKLLTGAKELTSVDISGCEALTNDACAAIILNCPKLSILDIQNCGEFDITSEGRLMIAKHYNKQIKTLTLNFEVDDDEICEIAQICPNLIELDLQDSHHLSDISMDKLAECCLQLKYLFLSSTQITDKSIMKIAQNCIHLQELALSFSNVTDISLIELSKHCNLKNSMYFYECYNITDVGVCAMIDKYTTLKTVTLSQCSLITDVTVEYIANKCSSLESINLFGCSEITDSSLLLLINKCDQLKEYCLNETDATSNVYDQIAYTHGCDYIRIIGHEPYFSAEINSSQFAISKQCRRNGTKGLVCNLISFPFSLPMEGVDNWYTKLTDFQIDSVFRVSDDLVDKLTLCCPLLHTVYIVNCNSHFVTYRSFQYISERLTHLHSLQMNKLVEITDEMVVQFLKLRGHKLRTLGLFQCYGKLTDQILYAISEHCSECLVELNVSGFHTFTNDAMNTIVYTCKKITKLNISGCSLLTSQILFEISQHCECLRELNIQDCAEIDHDSIVEFLMYYRQLNVLTHSDGVRVENF